MTSSYDTDRWDVVIVGARPAGAATALLLARAGLRVLAVDRAQLGSDILSTHALMRGGVLLLHRWGVLDQIVAAGTPPVRRVRFDFGADTINVSLRSAAGVDALYAPRRTVLDPVLVAAAEAAGARFRFGVTITDLLRDPAGRVTGVSGRDRAGKPVRIPAGLTVGADGARSLVARRARARTERLGAGGGGMVYGYWTGLEVTGYEWYYREGATAGLIPTNDGEVAVFAGTSAERFPREVSGDLAGAYHRLLKEATGGAGGRLADARPPGRLYGFPGRPSHLRQAGGPGWALVGDAGYYLDPLSTHGITDALRDATLLSRAVAAVHRGAEEGEALAGYQRHRDQLSGPLFDAVDAIASYGWDLDSIPVLLRASSAAMSAEVDAISRPKVDA
jgi:flavin-dependent dehydrogenase